MRNKKPFVTLLTKESYRNASNANQSPWFTKEYDTYKDLKKDLKKRLQENIENEVSVTRFKRGCWGEWFERWTLGVNGKPHIIQQGWM